MLENVRPVFDTGAGTFLFWMYLLFFVADTVPFSGPWDDKYRAVAWCFCCQAGHDGYGHYTASEYPHTCPATTNFNRAGCPPQRAGGCCDRNRPCLSGHCTQAHSWGSAGWNRWVLTLKKQGDDWESHNICAISTVHQGSECVERF